MVQIKNSVSAAGDCIGPLLGDGAPYSGMGIPEYFKFMLLQPVLLPYLNWKLVPVLKITGFPVLVLSDSSAFKWAQKRFCFSSVEHKNWSK